MLSGCSLTTLAIMRARWTRIVVAFISVAFSCIAVGTAGGLVGIPAIYGVTTAHALSVLDKRPLAWTAGWMAYSVVVLALAIVRARRISPPRPPARWVALRGSVWLWGAIGAPWIYVRMAWDLQLDGLYVPAVQSITLSAALWWWWWLSTVVSLLIGLAWSAWVASRPEPTIIDQDESVSVPRQPPLPAARP